MVCLISVSIAKSNVGFQLIAVWSQPEFDGWRKDNKHSRRGKAPTAADTWLVGGLEHFLLSHILGMSSSQLTNICQRGSNHQPVLQRILDFEPNQCQTHWFFFPWDDPQVDPQWMTILTRTILSRNISQATRALWLILGCSQLTPPTQIHGSKLKI